MSIYAFWILCKVLLSNFKGSPVNVAFIIISNTTLNQAHDLQTGRFQRHKLHHNAKTAAQLLSLKENIWEIPHKLWHISPWAFRCGNKPPWMRYNIISQQKAEQISALSAAREGNSCCRQLRVYRRSLESTPALTYVSQDVQRGMRHLHPPPTAA